MGMIADAQTDDFLAEAPDAERESSGIAAVHVATGPGNDSLTGTRADEVLLGRGGNDVLDGGGGRDSLLGGEGWDHLYGGKGGDFLTGGLGHDVFVLTSTAESSGRFGTDRIRDFVQGDDLFDLSLIDAKVAGQFNGRFDFVGEAAFSGKQGELRFVMRENSTVVHGDTNGDRHSDFTLVLDGAIPLLAADFLL